MREKRSIGDDVWSIIDGFIQDLEIVKTGLASAEFRLNLQNRLSKEMRDDRGIGEIRDLYRMRKLALIGFMGLITSCNNDIADIKREMNAINQLNDTLHFVEREEDWNSGKVEDTHIWYLIEKDSTIRRIVSEFKFGSDQMDTLNFMDYYYDNELPIYMSMVVVLSDGDDRDTTQHSEYFFEQNELVRLNCLKGEPMKESHLLMAAEFTMTSVKQIMPFNQKNQKGPSRVKYQ